ncbi:uncharacterized protein PGTG_20056 [Puccinia graminis f. sp. tritici CRL 75-36-700-3]|uniref:Uncharacterized protein n=1 Tax=Puccinia graminis f. sp. tritici (strain CRL 75-36-700-3 / race SCCL) TaxID=418459 RepID=E3NX74_PUCGT|nr:uncharacterized protein PGTG_20056 [Puccinia graminis f. sp. tritici CRL 75-36-700-3]EFP94173.1 hypothetical protein PGTG_20056 [Puccinia graminis f. sp. tritici CRL 75-36-700-3]
MTDRRIGLTTTRLLTGAIRRTGSTNQQQQRRRRGYSGLSSIEECLDSLKRNDPESVLQLPFWPKESQPGFVAIKSFHGEINNIPNAVSRSQKPLIAQMRYQWWRDAIDSCYLSSSSSSQTVDNSPINQIPSNHPLIHLLKPIIKQHKLSKYYFARIINASETHYLDRRLPTLTALADHSRSTTYASLSLLAQLLTSSKQWKENGTKLGGVTLATVDHSLSHLALFLTVVRILKQLPYDIRHRGTHSVPLELLECSEETLFRFFNPRRTYNNHQSLASSDQKDLHDAQDSLFNLIFLAWSELVAAREVISLDLSHVHSDDFRNHQNATLIQKHILSSRKSYLPKITIDRTLIPLFLPATPARTQLTKISNIILNTHKARRQEEQGNLKSHLIDNVARKADWTVPFKLWFNFTFNKL